MVEAIGGLSVDLVQLDADVVGIAADGAVSVVIFALADVRLLLRLVPEGVDGRIDILADRPWTSQGGQLLGSIELKADMPQEPTEMAVALPALADLAGKHALFFTFHSDTKEKSLCRLMDFVFE